MSEELRVEIRELWVGRVASGLFLKQGSDKEAENGKNMRKATKMRVRNVIDMIRVHGLVQ